MWFALLPILLAIAIYATWWNVIGDPPKQKVRDLGISLIGGIVGIAVFGGLIFWLCIAIAGITHEHLTF